MQVGNTVCRGVILNQYFMDLQQKMKLFLIAARNDIVFIA